MNYRSFISFVFVIALSGCAHTYWAKPGGTPNQFEADKAECGADAYRQFPPNVISNTTYSPAYNPPVQTNCYGSGGNMTCTTTQPNRPAPTTTTRDVNVQARDAAWESCMYNKGYQKTSAPK